jgi:hypothetical protein
MVEAAMFMKLVYNPLRSFGTGCVLILTCFFCSMPDNLFISALERFSSSCSSLESNLFLFF